jgi:hypothetical protein
MRKTVLTVIAVVMTVTGLFAQQHVFFPAGAAEGAIAVSVYLVENVGETPYILLDKVGKKYKL